MKKKENFRQTEYETVFRTSAAAKKIFAAAVFFMEKYSKNDLTSGYRYDIIGV